MKIAPIEVSYIGHSGTDLSVVNAARVSFHKESDWDLDPNILSPQLKQQDVKLINYLAKHKHKSPFNHCFLSFRVKAPIFVARQLVKHEYLPWNEVSRRYVDEEAEFYFPEYWRKKADNVKQGSSDDKVVLRIDTGYEQDGMEETPYELVKSLAWHYEEMLRQGVCAEQARMILPLNTHTEWIWSGTLFAFMKMVNLRLDPHTQKETQEVAKLIAVEIEKLFPVSYTALRQYAE